jgi:uncharacterized protein
MNLFSLVITVAGLCLFEMVSSVDNAIVNAEVLSTMSQKARKWFLTWGLLFAVVLIRGLLPWAIVWAATPGLGPIGAFTAAFSSDPSVLHAVEAAKPILLAGGGTFLFLLFFHWLFLEEKNFGVIGERFFVENGVWFYTVSSTLLCFIVWFSLQIHPVMAFGAVVGSTTFFLTHGFKQNAEKSEQKLMKGSARLTDISKILYLEVIDATFSFDGVLGAFAFTLSVPLIILGNGLGAIILRQVTVGNINRIKKYAYIKNGAMYSIFALGFFMLLEAFGIEVPSWVSPIATFIIVGYFLWLSLREMRKA